MNLKQYNLTTYSTIIMNYLKNTGSGKKFEELTSHTNNLIRYGFKKYNVANKFLFYKISFNNGKIIHCSQSDFRHYIKYKYNISMLRCPDEAYIIENNTGVIIKIVEKKYQIVNGTAETKLWSGPSLKREYQILFDEQKNIKFKVEYCFCVNDYFKQKIMLDKKFQVLKKILLENKIVILFGEDDNYYEMLDDWIFNL